MGRIVTVGYRRLKNLGNYENEACEATADVGSDDDPNEVLAHIREWVSSQLGEVVQFERRVRNLEERQYQANRDLVTARQALMSIRQRWEGIVPILDAHGVAHPSNPVPAHWLDDSAEGQGLGDTGPADDDDDDDDDRPF
jgi:hypothetical protein